MEGQRKKTNDNEEQQGRQIFSTMPRNRIKCNNEVKMHFQHLKHTNCNRDTTKKTCEVTGAYLNRLLYFRPLKTYEKYQICYNLQHSIDTKAIVPLTNQQRKQKNDDTICDLQREGALPVIPPSDTGNQNTLPVTDRQIRAERRSLILSRAMDKEKETDNDPPPPQSETSPNNPQSKKPFTKFHDKVKLDAKKFRMPYRDLKWRSRVERVDEIVSLIIANCIDHKEKDRSERGIKYIEKNNAFANQCMNVISLIHDRLETKLKMDLPRNDALEPLPRSVDDEEEEEKEKVNTETAIAILSESTGRGYERIRSKLAEALKGDESSLKLPSLYKINKQLPLEVEKVKFSIKEEVKGNENDANEREEALYGRIPVKTEIEALQLFSQQVDATDNSEEGTISIHGAKLKGGFHEWINAMVKKLEDKGYNLRDGEDLILINSFDGAEAIRTEKEVKGVISFSSEILLTSQVQSRNLNAGSSFNILTWMQLLGKEELGVLKPALEQYLKERKNLLEGGVKCTSLPRSKIVTYDVHDGKFLYLITSHSQWNRKHSPFILCNCKRGAWNETCAMWNDTQYTAKWKTSEKKWNVSKTRQSNWDVKKHRDWCDASNNGITHFGLDPISFPVSTIRFDTFHLSCAVIRRLMDCTRNFVLKQSCDLLKKFTDQVLQSFMSDYLIYCWNNKLKFSAFKGNDLILFLCNGDKIVEFFNKNLSETPELKNLCCGLQKLMTIIKFLSISRIESMPQYRIQLDNFKKEVQEFYEYGKLTYLKSEKDESFYFHCLRYYMPQIAEKTLSDHNLGLGIFTMQGFERRNKESKNTLKRFCSTNRTNLGSLLTNNVRRLQMVFFNENNAY